MHFTTLQFAVFFLVVLVLNWLLRRQDKVYRGFLLTANLFFYGSLNVRFLVLLLAVGFSNWLISILICRYKSPGARKALLVVNLFISLGLLAFFKYSEFFYSTLESLSLFSLGDSVFFAELIFPIGISFFTFQGLSYTIDVYRDEKQLVRNPVDVLIFISFFPTIMAGPIMRAGNFFPNLTSPVRDSRSFQVGFALILSGLFKKIVIASYLSEHIVRQVFQVPTNYSSLTVLAAVYSYSIQIFCDFAGYSEMAIGIAMLMGFNIPDNFRSPYRAVNLKEFWHRWHISLSTWLRDYLYISLGGNKLGTGRKYINLMITMILGGLWHGAHARFILWGTLHGLGLTLTHIFHDLRRRRRVPVTHIYYDLRRREHPGQETTPSPRTAPPPTWGARIGRLLCWFATFNFVSFLWVFFRAENAGRAFEIFRAVFTFSQPGAGFEFLVVLAILAGLGIQFWGHHVHDFYLKVQSRLPVPLQGLTVAILCIIILKMGPEGVLPFIYFQF